jgi:uncharacterized protein YndB with AHSA1/START domain
MNADRPGWTHTHRFTLQGSPDRVFTALTSPAELRRWFAEHVDVEPRAGGAYRFWGKHTFGWKYKIGGRDVDGGPTRILDLVPNRRLVTDWPDWRGDPSKPLTRVAWHLEPAGAGTRVTVVHGEFPRVVDISDYPFGWPSVLQQLKGLLEQ